jgi:hypothetical protein
MKTTIRLDAYNESSYNGNDLSIVGIVCKESGFVLAGGMNRKMKADFVKSEDFFVWSEENQKEFAEQIKICYFFITGKELEMATEGEKKKMPKMKI